MLNKAKEKCNKICVKLKARKGETNHLGALSPCITTFDGFEHLNYFYTI